jgi:hypothetical protein
MSVVAVGLVGVLNASVASAAAPVVPGTGTWIEYVGDDFEDPEWSFVHNLPKSSEDNNGATGGRKGYSTNGRWFEGPKRGQPDDMRVVATPPGGLPGSKGSLYVRTLDSGIPHHLSYGTEQDDLIVECGKRIGSIRPAEVPNFVVRIYLPPAEHWERRSGPHFGLRAGCSAPKTESAGFLGGSTTVDEPYWPGMWIHFRAQATKEHEANTAYLKVRGDRMGRDFYVRELETFGWWTMGMSVTGDGQIHYYARPGVDDLTADDYLTSQFPYGFRAQSFRTFFFNFCNRNDGKSWSTPFLLDDPQLFLVNAGRVESIVRQREAREQRTAEARRQRSRAQSQR